jgi:hypothetical protein
MRTGRPGGASGHAWPLFARMLLCTTLIKAKRSVSKNLTIYKLPGNKSMQINEFFFGTEAAYSSE